MELVKESLLKAAGFTAVVLLLGLLIGLQIDDARTSFIQDQIEESNLRAQTFIVTENYLSQSSQNYCGIVSEQIPEIADSNAQIGRDLQSMSSRSLSNKRDYKHLKEKYYVNQLRLYNLLEGYKDRCNSNITTVFFFFDETVNSQRQGAVLTEYRRNVNNRTYVFSYNLDTENSSVLEMLKNDYNVTEGPTLVINGKKVYRRYVSLKELKQIL